MRRRAIEQYHITRFLELTSPGPHIALEFGDAPDCTLRRSDATIGVEHTQFVFPTAPGRRPEQEVRSLQAFTVRRARDIFRARGGPALYVRPSFAGDAPRNKGDAVEIAGALADAVLRNGWNHFLAARTFLTSRELRCIHSYTVAPSVDGVDELWHAGAGGWVATVEPTHVQACLSKKAALYPTYRKRCDAVWLLVVNDVLRSGPFCELGTVASLATYHSPFERVFWLEWIPGRVIELPRVD